MKRSDYLKRPIITILFFYILGILSNDTLKVPFVFLLPILLFSLFFTLKKWYIILPIIFLMGNLSSNFHNNKYQNIENTETDQYIVYNVKEKEYGKEYTVKNAGKNPLKYQLRVFGETNFLPGSMIQVEGKISKPLENSNPGVFQYRNYLKSKNIYGIIEAEDYNVTRKGNTNNIFLKMKFSIINQLNNIFDENFSEKQAAFLKTIFLGENNIDEKDKEEIRALGISHLLAISGFHISLIYAFLFLLFNKMNISNNFTIYSILFLLWTYAYIVSWIPSVFRAVFMISFILLSAKWIIPWDRKNILFLSLGINLLINPFGIYDIGLQFSYLATFVIIEVLSKSPERSDSSIKDLILFSLSIYCFLLPVQIFYFNEIQAAFLLGNIFIVPVFGIVIISALLFLLFGGIPIIGGGIKVFTTWCLSFFDLLVEGASNFSQTIITKPLDFFAVVFIYLILYLFLKHRRAFLQYKKYILYSMLLIIISDLSKDIIYRPVTMTMIDIGQGDSILIESRQETILIDTGGSFWENDTSGEYVLRPVLKNKNIGKIDYLILSHFDEDHAGNIKMILEEFKPKAIVGREGGQGVLEEKYGIKYPYIDFNRKITFSDILIEPYIAEGNFDENNESLVFKLTSHNIRTLFTGDIEEDAERKYAEFDIQSEILKVPHHGSKTSSTDAFLEKVKPSLGLLSVGRNNSYGFPHQEIMDRYDKKGIPILRTDTHGAIEIVIHRFGSQVSTFLPKVFNAEVLISAILWTILFYVMLKNERIKEDEIYRWSEITKRK